MHLGICLPQCGALADTDLIAPFAQAAEIAGYDSLWVMDRLLDPVEPISVYPGVGKTSLPHEMERVLDPIGVMTVAALATTRVRIGSSVIVGPWYPPMLLARALTTLDLISKGRISIGIGLGWSIDEYNAVGVPMSERGDRYEDLVAALHSAWRDEIVSVDGKYVKIPPARVYPKPVQPGGPPLLLGLYSKKGLDRVARVGSGWNPNGLRIPQIVEGWKFIRARAKEYGRDPRELRLSIGANIKLTEKAIDDPERTMYFGSVDQIVDDLEATRRAGADEIILGEWEDPRSVAESAGPIDRVVSTWGVGPAPVVPHFETIAGP